MGVLETILKDENQVLITANHPGLRTTIARAYQNGALYRVAKGLYLPAGRENDIALLAHAICRFHPSAVITGWAALRLRVSTLSGWLELGEVIDVVADSFYAKSEKFQVQRRRFPPEHVDDSHGYRTPTLAYLAVEAAATDGGQLFTELQGAGLLRAHELAHVLPAFAGTRGQTTRQRVIAKLQHDPWSVAEQLLQRILLRADIDNWEGNVALEIKGKRYHPDIWFEAEQLAIEFNGRDYHTDAAAFHQDRQHGNLFLLAGIRVMRVSWTMLRDPYRLTKTVQACWPNAATTPRWSSGAESE